jgi:uroporphyrinogen III methyltransferase/synthase
MSGMVYLVGAGPGDPGLVTAKGLELIKKADCIVYDRLASPELLEYARVDCECIYVGKADSHHTLPQEEINALLGQKAREYRHVVRLKGGDVYVFGRGGEEGLYLREHGVPFTVVPGVSSAIAGAAYAGIPVTHRGIATSFRVITAHNRMDETTDLDFSTMLDVHETLIFLMGLAKVDEIAQGLLAAGRSADTPAAVVSHGTMSMQRVCVGQLSDIADTVRRQQLTSPAMIVVGDVVTLRSQLNFFEEQPLFGKSYLVPKIGKEPSALADMLRNKGAKVQECMVGQIVGVPAVYTAAELSQVDLLLFTSTNGVKHFMCNLFASDLDVRALAHAKLIAVGPKTAEELKKYGLCADFIPQQYNADTLAEELKPFIEKNCHKSPFERAVAWYPAAKNAGDELVDTLLGVCDCGRLNVYENVICEPDSNEDLFSYDGILFTCASSAKRLLQHCDEDTRIALGTHTDIYSIGPKCSAALSSLGVTPVTESAVSTYEGLYNTILRR